ncbi:MAG: FumA C-terminus/TtdB family hydratase beta subunit [Candidatus Nezhaarchaeota archaeon]|nr:FumA C-terminus/TtdB family hydratase beta subunit [Candidatus Nezhaarchaeota archaeon]
MVEEYELTTPLDDVRKLKVRDIVYINGIVYTARDLAHIRIKNYLEEGKQLPVNFRGAVIFHAGPAVRKRDGEWEVTGIGPTTSYRMEPFSEIVFGKLGVKALVGKGRMGGETLESLRKYGGVFLVAPPGCSAIIVESVEKVLGSYWLDLGVPEAIWILKVKRLGPLIVAMDSHGNSIFNEVRGNVLRALNEIYSIIGVKR